MSDDELTKEIARAALRFAWRKAMSSAFVMNGKQPLCNSFGCGGRIVWVRLSEYDRAIECCYCHRKYTQFEIEFAKIPFALAPLEPSR